MIYKSNISKASGTQTDIALRNEKFSAFPTTLGLNMFQNPVLSKAIKVNDSNDNIVIHHSKSPVSRMDSAERVSSQERTPSPRKM